MAAEILETIFFACGGRASFSLPILPMIFSGFITGGAQITVLQR